MSEKNTSSILHPAEPQVFLSNIHHMLKRIRGFVMTSKTAEDKIII
jgi:hypothetical protein